MPKLPKVVEDCPRLPKLPKVVKSCKKLPKIAKQQAKSSLTLAPIGINWHDLVPLSSTWPHLTATWMFMRAPIMNMTTFVAPSQWQVGPDCDQYHNGKPEPSCDHNSWIWHGPVMVLPMPSASQLCGALPPSMGEGEAVLRAAPCNWMDGPETLLYTGRCTGLGHLSIQHLGTSRDGNEDQILTKLWILPFKTRIPIWILQPLGTFMHTLVMNTTSFVIPSQLQVGARVWSQITMVSRSQVVITNHSCNLGSSYDHTS